MPKTVVITGSTSGLGKATAKAALAAGANVVVSSEQAKALAETLEEFSDFGERVAGIVCDVTDFSQVEALRDHVLQQFSAIDCWINNAGTTAPSGSGVSVPVTSGSLTLTTNIFGTYHGSVVAVRQFRKQGCGRLINLAGRGAKGPVPTASLYGSSKSWVRSYTLAIAKEEKDSGIQIGTFNPGMVYTPLIAQPQVLKGEEERMMKGLKMVMPLIGDPPEKPAASLAVLALQDAPIKLENNHRSLLLHVLKRLLTGKRADVDLEAIEPRIIDPEA